MTASTRRTIGASDNPALLAGVRAKNNGRYNGNGREWATPPEVFDPLDAEFHFTLDACATAANAKCPIYFSEAEDGLKQPWGGHRVFMNPPYGREVYAWTRKARSSSACSPRRRTSRGGTRTWWGTRRSDTSAGGCAS